MKTAAFYTLGCKVNQYDTEAISGIFKEFGYRIIPFDDKADVYVINTCTVTALSERKSRQMIRKAKRNNPLAVVIVTGCYSQAVPDEVSGIGGVRLVTGTSDRHKIREFLDALEDGAPKRQNESICQVSNITQVKSFEEMKSSPSESRTRAYLKIQEGCDRFCSYCIIPYVRGHSRSRRPADVLEEARKLAEQGYKEVVVTGIHTASYGRDIGSTSLTSILKDIHSINGIERIRLGSIEPGTVTGEFINTVKNLEKLCPQYHISLQSGCDETLKRMNRKYTRDKYKTSIEALRENIKDVAITTDVMTGFPGETKREFHESYKFLESICFSRIHVFKYSPRKGTAAYSFEGQVSAQEKEARSKAVIELSKKCALIFNKSLEGREMSVLFEQPIKNDKALIEGLTPNYIKVVCRGHESLCGCIKSIRLVKAEQDYMIGEL
jgi:threonylcarbamoyladenosine tRNA methylthiotransferase MtaB